MHSGHLLLVALLGLVLLAYGLGGRGGGAPPPPAACYPAVQGFAAPSARPPAGVVVTLYHADWCGFCRRMMGEWDAFAARAAARGIAAEKVEERDIAGRFPVRGFPTVVRRGGGAPALVFRGPRTAAALLAFAERGEHGAPA